MLALAFSSDQVACKRKEIDVLVAQTRRTPKLGPISETRSKRSWEASTTIGKKGTYWFIEDGGGCRNSEGIPVLVLAKEIEHL